MRLPSRVSAAEGKNVLFVGTKRQAQEAIAEEATRCEMFYVNQRWLGGLLTNMVTVQKSIKRLKELEMENEVLLHNIQCQATPCKHPWVCSRVAHKPEKLPM